MKNEEEASGFESEISDDEYFEINDFTSASNWEKLIALLEKGLYALTPTNTGDDQAPSEEKRLSFKEDEIHLVRVSYPQPCGGSRMLDFSTDEDENESNSEAHIPSRFGVYDFIVLYYVADDIWRDDDDWLHVVLSMVLIAVANTKCTLPVFVPMRHGKLHFGVCQNGEVRTSFETVFLRNYPRSLFFLSGIVELFEEKLNMYAFKSQNMIKVSACHTFESTPLVELSRCQPLPQNWSADDGFDVDFDEERFIRPGCSEDSLEWMRTKLTWYSLNENTVTENDRYTDFAPAFAPHMTVRVSFVSSHFSVTDDDSAAIYTLTSSLNKFLDLINHVPFRRSSRSPVDDSDVSTHEYLRLFDPEMIKRFESSCDDNVERCNSLFITKSNNKARFDRFFCDFPYDDEKVEKMANVRANSLKLNNQSTGGEKNIGQTMNPQLKFEQVVLRAKAAPTSGLTSYLSQLLCKLYWTTDDFELLIRVYNAFRQSLTDFWHNCEEIPGLLSTIPSRSRCLLHQKLQMLNYCIAEERKRRAAEESAKEEVGSDEFYDCSEAGDEFYDCSKTMPTKSEKPMGRKQAIENCFLVKRPSQPLYIPVTQDPPPFVTDDKIEAIYSEDDQYRGHKQRRNVYKIRLLYDMEAFQAANPGCIFADFLRWYSPRDVTCISEGDPVEQKYSFSKRMRSKDNFWKLLWKTALPVPASKQAKLFDHRQEAVDILDWFATLDNVEILRLLAPALFGFAIKQLLAVTPEELLPQFEPQWDKIFSLFEKAVERGQMDDYQMLTRLLRDVEATLVNHQSLKAHFDYAVERNGDLNPDLRTAHESELKTFLIALLSSKEVKVIGGSRSYIGQLVLSVMQQNETNEICNDSLSMTVHPLKKEYVLHLSIPQPTNHCRDCSQRLYVSVADNEFRAHGSFGEDILFGH